MSARQELHAAGVAYVARALRRRGCPVRTVPNSAVSLEAAGLALGVRVARTRMVAHPVTVAGRRYRYTYPIMHFNLHAHGEKIHAPDVWVLVAVGARFRVWVIPAAVLARCKTAQVLDTPSAQRSTRGRLRAYEGRWDLIVGGRKAKRAA